MNETPASPEDEKPVVSAQENDQASEHAEVPASGVEQEETEQAEVTTEAEESTESSEESTEQVPEVQAEDDAAPAPAPSKRRFPKKKMLIMGVVVINIGLAATNAYVWTRPQKTQAAVVNTVKTKTVSTAVSKPSNDKTESDIKTLHYTSKPLNLEFDYPVDWRVSSSSDNTSIDLTSSPFNFVDSEGHAAMSNIDVTISSLDTTNDAFAFMGDSDLIQENSEPLTYANPVPGQRKQTNLSFASYSSDVNGQINNLFVSGNNAYVKGQSVGSKDYKKVHPHINMYIDPCAAVHCQSLMEAPFTINDWHTNPQLLKVKDIIQSLRLN